MTELTGVGLSNEALSRSRRKLLDLINRLHSTGAQVDVDLPQIAVIGSQSAGKSSLIEFISGITLPRASGTCTRCPTEFVLRAITDEKGQVLGQPKNQQFVEERIRRAQFAILNPSTSPDHFLTGDHNEPGDTELTFSTNCVSLSISGPDVADLSFCDLPGLIASVGIGGKETDIKLVEHLVTSYISKQSCVILLTVACETDFENQGAHHLAKKHDPKGKRTIGVLTKPDRIPIGDEESWMRFIKNEKEPLENNWYCASWVLARQREDDWFSMTAPWSTMDPFYKRYLRTTNLVERLSANLSELLKRRLPEIQTELQKALQRASASLSLLPKPPSRNPQLDIATRLAESAFRVFLTKTGSRPHQEKFRKRVQDTAPIVMPVERKRAKGMKLPIFEFLAQEEEKKGGGPEKEGEAGKVEVGRSRGNLLSRTNIIYIDEVHLAHFTFHKTWLEPAIGLCNDTYKILLNHVDDLITSNFGDVGEGLLEQHIGSCFTDHLKDQLKKTTEKVVWLHSLEDLPFTLNNHYLSDYARKFLSRYTGHRQRHLHGHVAQLERYKPPSPQSEEPSSNHQIKAVLTNLVALGFPAPKPVDLYRVLPPDEMEIALDIMANMPNVFWTVAYKRYVDIVPLAIDFDLVRGVQQHLYAPDGYQICQEYAEESSLKCAKKGKS
ncbi:P-loop containing nucleoside triphosphate hydrolase protein [Mucidula mucida]|nr:P-loop containing nucleoside triphosphate hydrolase protein [Mucidula mucida]